jgi:hypothetical protein
LYNFTIVERLAWPKSRAIWGILVFKICCMMTGCNCHIHNFLHGVTLSKCIELIPPPPPPTGLSGFTGIVPRFSFLKITAVKDYRRCIELMKTTKARTGKLIYDGTDEGYASEDDLIRSYYKLKTLVREAKEQ